MVEGNRDVGNIRLWVQFLVIFVLLLYLHIVYRKFVFS